MKKVLKRETYRPLSIYEQNVLLPIMIKGLKMKKTKANAVTANGIVLGIRSQGLRINCRNVERIIQHIRINDLIVGLMASSIGYFVTNNEQELMDYEKSLLCREASLRNTRMTMQRQRREMFSKMVERQTQLF